MIVSQASGNDSYSLAVLASVVLGTAFKSTLSRPLYSGLGCSVGCRTARAITAAHSYGVRAKQLDLTCC